MSIVSNSIINADAEARYLSPGELDQIKAFVSGGQRRLRVAPLDDSRGMCTYYCPQPKTTAVEMTAYALLTFTEQNAVSFGLPIMKWLLSKQSKFGGYGSTQVYRR